MSHNDNPNNQTLYFGDSRKENLPFNRKKLWQKQAQGGQLPWWREGDRMKTSFSVYMLLFILYYLRVVKTALVLMSCRLIRPSAAERSNTPGTESACLCSAVDLSGAPGGNVLLPFPCCTAAAPTGSTPWKELKSEFRVEDRLMSTRFSSWKTTFQRTEPAPKSGFD